MPLRLISLGYGVVRFGVAGFVSIGFKVVGVSGVDRFGSIRYWCHWVSILLGFSVVGFW